ncbi:MAG: Ribosomal RNA small subunit methyltransferase I [Chroococcopsis gigantea SAG 12.99]|jgi:16S rRNA (cytidine1402-2'-O)-methyltransferase|nr:Ribosomal RNA small subunit methyltransferase I [Chroococcopsis gigantea SAG 12.99]
MAQTGKLYIVGTPIGNLQDMTFRAVETLKKVNLIAAEDTRHTGKLLQYFEVGTPQISYHHHNRLSRQNELLEILFQGKDIALVTDAGTPGISDPGYELIRDCLEANIEVIPIPGVTAVITALSVSGLVTDKFVFEGFLSTKDKYRKEKLQELQTENRTIVFYEAPHKLLDTLKDLAKYLGGERLIILGRELTKLHEELWRGKLSEAVDIYENGRQPKGEYTLVVEGDRSKQVIDLSDEEIKDELTKIMAGGVSRSQASKQLAHLTKLPRRRLYEIALSI